MQKWGGTFAAPFLCMVFLSGAGCNSSVPDACGITPPEDDSKIDVYIALREEANCDETMHSD